jgi:hypothetical protein
MLTRSDGLVLKDVEGAEFDLLIAQERDRLSREAAARRVRLALHEEHDAMLTHDLLQALLELGG